MSQYHFHGLLCLRWRLFGFSLEAGEIQVIDANWYVRHIGSSSAGASPEVSRYPRTSSGPVSSRGPFSLGSPEKPEEKRRRQSATTET